MSKLDEKIAYYAENAKKIGVKVPADLLAKVTKGLGPSIYKQNSEGIACSKSNELETVKKNFLRKKLGLTEEDAVLDKAIQEVCEEMGKSNRNKYRAIFYALLVKKFKKESVYA